MSEIVGRAGFHAVHTKDVGERSAILHEMMRELDDDAVAYWAERNPNIVVADEALNVALVNDGQGGFRPCADPQEVIAYGDGRIAKVRRKFTEDRPTLDKKTGRTEMKGGTITTTMIVAHLPKSMCVEVRGFYPVLDSESGEPVLDADGAPRTRSRWVARDRDEAIQYFRDVVSILEGSVIPGGHDGVHGADIQFSESTPHVQVLADTFGVDSKHPDALRADASRAWFEHREVKDAKGRMKPGPVKMREYHAGLKAALIEKGYDISPDFDEERHMTGYTKDDYSRVQDRERVNVEATARISNDHRVLNDWDARLLEERHRQEDSDAALREREAAVGSREVAVAQKEQELGAQLADVPRRRQKAVEEGKDEGLAAGREEAYAEAKRRADEAIAAKLADLRAQPLPQLFEEYLDRQDAEGRSYRPGFERFVDQRLRQFEAEHDVVGRLELELGDRERFVEDGGEALGIEVAELQNHPDAPR